MRSSQTRMQSYGGEWTPSASERIGLKVAMEDLHLFRQANRRNLVEDTAGVQTADITSIKIRAGLQWYHRRRHRIL
jgi:hypothetical protein